MPSDAGAPATADRWECPSTRRASCWTARRWTAWCRSERAAATAGGVRRHGRREDDDLRARTRRGRRRHAVGAAIIRDTAGRDYRFSSLVLGIVKSAPFTMRMKVSPSARLSDGGRGSTLKHAAVETSGWAARARIVPTAAAQGATDVHLQDGVTASDGSSWDGRHAGAAAPRRDGAGLDGVRQDGREPTAPVRSRVRAARRATRLLDARHGRIELRVHADPQADREVPPAGHGRLGAVRPARRTCARRCRRG